SRRRHTRSKRDWSSDVCSSDLYPHAAKVMRPGDAVVDIGSGSGTDVLYAALKVGPKGTVYGLDITPAMIAKARTNIAKTGARNEIGRASCRERVERSVGTREIK